MPEKKNAIGDINVHVQGDKNRFGNIGHVINRAPQRALSEAHKTQLRLLPKSKGICLTWCKDPEAERLAAQFRDFFRSEGYDITRERTRSYLSETPTGVQINDLGSEIEVFIGLLEH